MTREPLGCRDVNLAVNFLLAVNGDAVLLAGVMAFVVFCLLAGLILKELNRHR